MLSSNQTLFVLFSFAQKERRSQIKRERRKVKSHCYWTDFWFLTQRDLTASLVGILGNRVGLRFREYALEKGNDGARNVRNSFLYSTRGLTQTKFPKWCAISDGKQRLVYVDRDLFSWIQEHNARAEVRTYMIDFVLSPSRLIYFHDERSKKSGECDRATPIETRKCKKRNNERFRDGTNSSFPVFVLELRARWWARNNGISPNQTFRCLQSRTKEKKKSTRTIEETWKFWTEQRSNSAR